MGPEALLFDPVLVFESKGSVLSLVISSLAIFLLLGAGFESKESRGWWHPGGGNW
jgi:hypothetical protein